jgi:hypothetical protein
MATVLERKGKGRRSEGVCFVGLMDWKVRKRGRKRVVGGEGVGLVLMGVNMWIIRWVCMYVCMVFEG